MADEEYRKELIEIFNHFKGEVDFCLENHNILPASITHNKGKAGITIEFHENCEESEDKES